MMAGNQSISTFAQNLRDRLKNAIEHFCGQPPSVDIAPRAVITGDSFNGVFVINGYVSSSVSKGQLPLRQL